MKGDYDADLFGYLDLVDEVEKLGYISFEKLGYCEQGSIIQLVYDDSFMTDLVQQLNKGVKYFHIYVHGGVKSTQQGEEINAGYGDVGNDSADGSDDNGSDAFEGDDSDTGGEKNKALEGVEAKGHFLGAPTMVDLHESQIEAPTMDDVHEVEVEAPIIPEVGTDIDELVDNFCGASDGFGFSDSDDPAYNPSGGDSSEDGMSDCDLASDDEEFIQARQNWKSFKNNVHQEKKQDPNKGELVKVVYCNDEDDSNSDINSDSTSTESSKDVDVTRKSRKKIKYDPNCDHSRLEFCTGMRFVDGYECKRAVQLYGLAHGLPIQFTRGGIHVLEAHCRNKDCDWKLYASTTKRDSSFEVKTIHGKHQCQRDLDNQLATTDFLVRQFYEDFRGNPKFGVKDMQMAVLKKYCVNVTKWKCYRAKWTALQRLRGTISEQYSHLKAYKGELLRVDKYGRYEFLLEDDGSFKGFFVGFSALIQGFQKGCRRVIGFDGCFLKTVTGGALLTAVAKDGNNQMFPICYAVVQVENEFYWTWFMSILFEELGINDELGWTFMSDQHKGLLNSMQKLAPHASIRNCARHVYMNWKKSFKGQSLKNLFWRAVKSTYEAEFHEVLKEMKEENEEAAEDFMNRDPTKWCKAYISPDCKTDMVDNNVCETFNGWIVKSRSKHIIDMLEEIRCALMERQVNNVMSNGGGNDKICPRIRKNVEANIYASRNNVTIPAVGDKFQVSFRDDQFVVDLTRLTCSCRLWDLTGIPCTHACSAISYMKRDVTDYVNFWYGLGKYMDAYSVPLVPINGRKMWLPNAGSPIKPPPFRVMPGRPKKKRKRAAEEEIRKGKMSKCGVIMKCGKCGGEGHNKRSCKSTTVTRPPKVPGKRGRPKKPSTTEPTQTSTSRGEKNVSKQPRGSGLEKERRQVRKGYGVRVFDATGNIYTKTGRKVRHVKGHKNHPSSVGYPSNLETQSAGDLVGSGTQQSTTTTN